MNKILKRSDHKKQLLDKLDRLSSLPGNWDDKGGQPASPRATGNYKAFLDMLNEVKSEHEPHLEKDGSIKVTWKTYVTGKPAHAVVKFYANGGMHLGYQTIVGEQGNDFKKVERDRLQKFIYATS